MISVAHHPAFRHPHTCAAGRQQRMRSSSSSLKSSSTNCGSGGARLDDMLPGGWRGTGLLELFGS